MWQICRIGVADVAICIARDGPCATCACAETQRACCSDLLTTAIHLDVLNVETDHVGLLCRELLAALLLENSRSSA